MTNKRMGIGVCGNDACYRDYPASEPNDKCPYCGSDPGYTLLPKVKPAEAKVETPSGFEICGTIPCATCVEWARCVCVTNPVTGMVKYYCFDCVSKMFRAFMGAKEA